ncbi:hypothetical protein [Microbispora sp. NBRC 16548]|nr:hypothetical protein [Microbispora sp. NBRC 16548]GLX06771.1 hypothetical protein Misp03_36980 [Microbispora sp. NBRC 16548]
MNYVALPALRDLARWGGLITVVVVVLYILVLTGTKIELAIGPAA